MNNTVQHAIDTQLSSLQVTSCNVDTIFKNVREGKKVKKKLSVAFILTLVLVLIAVTALAATLVSGYYSFLNDDDNSPTSAVLVDDTLYMMTTRGLMNWEKANDDARMEMGTQALQAYGISVFSMLFDNDGLMMLDVENEKIWKYNAGNPMVVLDYHATGVDFGDNFIDTIVYEDGALFLLGKFETDTTLFRWDINNNVLEAMPIQGIISIAKYKTGKLLCIQRDYSAIDRLVGIDCASGDITFITSQPLMNVDGLAYSKTLGVIYGMVGGSLQCYDGTDWQIVRQRSVPANSFYFAVLDSGYVAVSINGAQYVTFDGAEDGNTLYIAGYTSSENLSENLDNEFEATHMGTTVVREISPHYCAAEIAEAIQNGETVDLFHVRLTAEVIELFKNGTLGAIDADDTLIEICSSMLPQIADALFYQDALYAVPSDMLTVYNWEASAPEKAVDTLLSTLIAENAAIGSTATSALWGRGDYVRYLLEQYITTHADHLDFTQDDFLSYLSQFKAANLPEWPVYTSNMDCFVSTNNFLLGKDEPTYYMPSPRLSTEYEAQVPVSMRVYVLNPNSRNKEGAIEYLSYIAENYEKATAAMFNPVQASSTLFSFFQEYIDEETTSGNPDTSRIERILNEPTFWLITEEALTYYRDVLSPHLNLMLHPLLADRTGWHDTTFPDMVDTVLAYLRGSGTAEECASKLNELAK